ncbi:energy transducer TonB [uncultured Tenacibaculum sp.]|uniref:energy transducer TonB n=1 Tax=uncultured Tenacibaculum sp. TaxID=174713 RepID=UPI002610D38F|nr:energy transducer TonB [uncultured Tenacibaculum sp.]
MFKKVFAVAVLLITQQLAFSQSKKDETCDTPAGDPALDLNSITKCTVNSKDAKSKKISVEVTSRRRVIRKRDAVTGVNSSSATSNKLAELKKKASIVGNLDLSNEEVVDKIPFNLVEEIPLFEKCQSVAIFKQERCFREQVSKHIQRYFSYPEEAYEKSIQGRVLVQFVIDKDGSVSDMNFRSPYKGDLLEKEAKRIVSKLPKFIPGKHNGRAVKVKYGIPINFKIKGRKPSNIKRTRKFDEKKDKVYTFENVDQVPQFDGCKGNKTQKCFNEQFSKHIVANYVYPEDALQAKIQGKISVYFVVDVNGDIANIRTRGPQGAKSLEEAAAKLIQSLPKLKPALKRGKEVNVKYNFPINFSLN